MNDRVTLVLKNEIAEIDRLHALVEQSGARFRLPPKTLSHVMLALEEVVTNVIKYAFKDGREHEIRVTLSVEPGLLRAEVVDDGLPFNPLEAPEPDLAKDLADRPIGGLGIHLVRSVMDDLRYHRAGRENHFILTKKVAT